MGITIGVTLYLLLVSVLSHELRSNLYYIAYLFSNVLIMSLSYLDFWCLLDHPYLYSIFFWFCCLVKHTPDAFYCETFCLIASSIPRNGTRTSNLFCSLMP